MFGKAADLWVGGEEPAGFDDAAFPFVAVKIEGYDGRDMDDRFCLGEVVLSLLRLKLFERGLFRGVGAEGIFVCCIGGDPKSVT
jgi:hypothetical protein